MVTKPKEFPANKNRIHPMCIVEHLLAKMGK
jgi:hypothetical protein